MEVKVIESSEIRIHKCYNCNEPQLSELDLKNHLLSCVKAEQEIDDDEYTEETTIDKPYKCNLCDNEFASASNLRRHLKRIHRETKQIECDICGMKIAVQLVNLHKSKVHGNIGLNNFECDICQGKFKSLGNLKHHFSRKHDKAKNFKCDICDQDFHSPGELKSHENVTHQGIRNLVQCKYCNIKITPAYLQKHINSIHLKNKDLKCSICSDTFALKDSLQKHMNFVHLGLENLSNSRRKSRSKQTCNFCQKIFVSRSVLKLHIDSIHLQKKHTCSICNEIFAFGQGLQRHVKAVHFKERKFTCGFCTKTFALKATLKLHEDSVHLKIRNFKCDKCDKAFTCSSNLSRHVKDAHIIEKIQCSFCNSTVNRSYIKVHEKEFHSKENISHKCDICNKSFFSKAVYRMHSKIHRTDPFTSDRCSEAFGDLSTLKTHKLNSHNENSTGYECSVCKKEYKSRQSCFSHEKIHEEGLQNCDQCKTVLKGKKSLKMHLKTVHSKNPKKFYCNFCLKSFSQKNNLNRHISVLHLNN